MKLTGNGVARGVVVFAAAVAVLSAGCAAERRTVRNEPPIIKKDAISFGSDFGVMEPESMSIFFWPSNLSEPEVEGVVKTVKDASAEIDRLMIELQKMAGKRMQLTKEFKVHSCAAKWAVIGRGQKAEALEWVSQWKAAPADNAERDEYEACVHNQETRKSLAEAMKKNLDVDQMQVKAVILKAVDPEFPQKQENYKSVSAKGSKLAIRQSDSPASGGVTVEVSLKDFLALGNNPSTDVIVPADRDDIAKMKAAAHRILGAHYDLKRRLLTFAVPEVGTNGLPTGAAYQFLLERNPDFLGYARFAGEMRLVKDGQILRYGSARIDGLLKPK